MTDERIPPDGEQPPAETGREAFWKGVSSRAVARLSLVKDGLWKVVSFHRRDANLYIIGLFAALTMAYYANKFVDAHEMSMFVQFEGLLFALLWTLLNAQNLKAFFVQAQTALRTALHPAWLVVFASLVLRYYMLTIFPPAGQTGFEEIQAGAGAYGILHFGEIPIEFRFTNLMGAWGLFYHSSGTLLASLRFPFQLAGLFFILFTTFSLRSLKVSWLPAFLVVVIAASLRFLVLASGFADELFAGLPILSAFILLIIKSQESREARSFWLAAAGIFAGILMYEYTSYRAPVAVVGLWLVWTCLATRKSDDCLGLFSFLVSFILVSVPTFVETIHHPQEGMFFEAFVRHGGVRETIFSEGSLFQLKAHLFSLFGFPSEISAHFTPIGEPMILPLIGWLFFAGSIFGLFFAGRGLPRVLALGAFVTIFGASFLANNLNIGRMAPIFPALLLLSGLLLEKAYQKIVNLLGETDAGDAILVLFPRRENSKLAAAAEPLTDPIALIAGYRQVSVYPKKLIRASATFLAVVLYALAMYLIPQANVDSLWRLAKDESVINEYVNDEYSICSYVGSVVKPLQQTYIYSPDGVDYCATNLPEAWYFGNKQPRIVHLLDQFIAPDALVPGDLVVAAASNRGLTAAEYAQLIELGHTLNCLDSLQVGRNWAGRMTSASICFQCAP